MLVHSARRSGQTRGNNVPESLPKRGCVVACSLYSTPFRGRFRETASTLDNFQPNSGFSSISSQTLLLFHAVSLHLLCEKARIVFYACQPLLLKRDKLCFRSQICPLPESSAESCHKFCR